MNIPDSIFVYPLPAIASRSGEAGGCVNLPAQLNNSQNWSEANLTGVAKLIF